MIKTPKAKEYGKRMQVISHMYLNRWTKRFKATERDFERDMKMVFDDARNLYMVGAYMIEGNFDAAMAVANDMDTLVRDEIPRSVYNYLEKYTLDQED